MRDEKEEAMMTGHLQWIRGRQHRVIAAALFSLLSAATSASAQNTPWPANGNVGIGTTSPAAPLTIVSTPSGEAVRVIGRATGGVDEANLMLFKNDGSTFHGAIIGSNGTLNLMGGSGGIAVTVTGSRNVGIGTTNPPAPLTVQSSSRAEGIRVIGRAT